MPGRSSTPARPPSSPGRTYFTPPITPAQSWLFGIRAGLMNVDRDQLKRMAALRAIEEVEDGMVVGRGPGPTAAFVAAGLAARVAAGLRVVGVPTSERTAAQARRLGIPIATFAEHQRLDLTID